MRIAYKAFDPDLSCTSGGNRYQYQTGIWNEEPQANCRKDGFHCAENPLDCLTYYRDWKKAVFYLVLADGDMDEDDSDSKISCTRIKLVKRLNLYEFIAHSLRYMYLHPHIKNNWHVKDGQAEAVDGFAVVRGKRPAAKGKPGDILGLVRESADSRKVLEIGLHMVDGIHVMPDTWYGVEGQLWEKEAA